MRSRHRKYGWSREEGLQRLKQVMREERLARLRAVPSVPVAPTAAATVEVAESSVGDQADTGPMRARL